jgi:hypothetical protein
MQTRRDQALDLMDSLDQETSGPREPRQETAPTAFRAAKLLGFAVRRLNDADPRAATERVRRLRTRFPGAERSELVEKLLKAKCQKTATIGASTSAAAIVPGLGTALALTIGMAVDISSSLKLNAELVLEIAAVYGHRLTETQRNEVILAVTGISVGAEKMGGAAVKGVSRKAAERIAQKWAAKAVPAVGMAASASTNVLATYLIGRRAEAFFGRGPEALGDWQDDLRAISGVDERKISGWLAERGRLAGNASASVSRRVGRQSRRYARSLAEAGGRAADGAAAAGDRLARAASAAGGGLLRRISRKRATPGQPSLAVEPSAEPDPRPSEPVSLPPVDGSPDDDGREPPRDHRRR